MEEMKVSDIICDSSLIFYDERLNHYFELKIDSTIVDGFTDLPVTTILRKGKRVYKKDLRDYDD